MNFCGEKVHRLKKIIYIFLIFLLNDKSDMFTLWENSNCMEYQVKKFNQHRSISNKNLEFGFSALFTLYIFSLFPDTRITPQFCLTADSNTTKLYLHISTYRPTFFEKPLFWYNYRFTGSCRAHVEMSWVLGPMVI